MDVVPETLEILKKWGCDGTDFPAELHLDANEIRWYEI